MSAPLFIAQAQQQILGILPNMANRHGLIAGATGTGKTITLQTLAEAFSGIGVPVFMADVKGDLSGISQAGGGNAKVEARLAEMAIKDPVYRAAPTVFWDVFGKRGHPLRSTLSDMGPLLLSRMLNLNEVQSGVLNAVFKLADDNHWLLLDLKDLRSLLQFASEQSAALSAEYGNISAASVGAIQRGLLQLEQEGGDLFFGEPALNFADLLQTVDGQGVINILAADSLYNSPRIYATLLLWLLSELFENLPEAGDLEKPKLVFFFDEAHLLFNDAPAALLQKIEQMVRLIRSKGVGVYFVSQNPLDIPDVVLGQLGNRVQHALRSFTPRDQKAVKAAAETFRSNPNINVETVIGELAVGEALISCLDEKGIPLPVERALIKPPCGRIGPASDTERQAVMQNSILNGFYEKKLDRESAYEILHNRAAPASAVKPESSPLQTANDGGLDWGGLLESAVGGALGQAAGRGRARQGVLETAAKSAARSIGQEVGKQLIRGVLGSLIGGRR